MNFIIYITTFMSIYLIWMGGYVVGIVVHFIIFVVLIFILWPISSDSALMSLSISCNSKESPIIRTTLSI